MTNHVFLARPLSTLLRAICWPLLPGCEFWCGRVVLLTRQAISRSSSTASPFSTSCEGWAGACTTRFLTVVVVEEAEVVHPEVEAPRQEELAVGAN